MIRPPSAEVVGGACDVCGSVDRLGLGTCVACARAGSDALLFLESPERRADRQVIEAWLVGALDGAVSRSDAREAAGGSRPVVGLPAAAAGRAVGALGLRGVPAVAVPPEVSWKRLPLPLLVLAGLSGGLGLFVGLTGTPALIVLGPIFSVLLVAAALRRLTVPVWLPEASGVLGLPLDVEPDVRATLQRLPPGRARTALRDLATLAAQLCRDEPLPPDEEMLEASGELLRLACGAVVDLDELDRCLEVLDREPADPSASEAIEEAVARAAKARDSLARRLDEALASLARARVASPDSSADLLRAAERLAEQSLARSEAWKDVERLTS